MRASIVLAGLAYLVAGAPMPQELLPVASPSVLAISVPSVSTTPLSELASVSLSITSTVPAPSRTLAPTINEEKEVPRVPVGTDTKKPATDSRPVGVTITVKKRGIIPRLLADNTLSNLDLLDTPTFNQAAVTPALSTPSISTPTGDALVVSASVSVPSTISVTPFVTPRILNPAIDDLVTGSTSVSFIVIPTPIVPTTLSTIASPAVPTLAQVTASFVAIPA